MRPPLIIQAAMGSYRDSFLDELLGQTDVNLAIGDEHFNTGLQTSVFAKDLRDFRLVNHFLLNRRLMWQRGALGPGLRACVVVLEYNPRIISNVAIALLRFLLGRRTVVWGHWSPRSGRDGIHLMPRLALLGLCREFLAYTPVEARIASRHPLVRNVYLAPNAVMRTDEMRALPHSSPDEHGIVYVGRIVPDKKVDLLLRAVPLINESVKVHIVGDGPNLESLRDDVIRMGVQSRVTFHGRMDSASSLAKVYEKCILAVQPGYAGLSATQSLGFGVPLLTGDRDPHAPEVSLLKDGFNALRFESDSPESLALAVNEFVCNRSGWLERRSAIVDSVRAYSVEQMAQGFVSVLVGGGPNNWDD